MELKLFDGPATLMKTTRVRSKSATIEFYLI